MSEQLSDNDLRVQARLALAAKSAAENLFFRNAWRRVEESIHRAASMRDKNFEVHHRVEDARRKFLTAMCGGASHEDCERATIAPAWAP